MPNSQHSNSISKERLRLDIMESHLLSCVTSSLLIWSLEIPCWLLDIAALPRPEPFSDGVQLEEGQRIVSAPF